MNVVFWSDALFSEIADNLGYVMCTDKQQCCISKLRKHESKRKKKIRNTFPLMYLGEFFAEIVY